jgi:hypothetical protein
VGLESKGVLPKIIWDEEHRRGEYGGTWRVGGGGYRQLNGIVLVASSAYKERQ